MIKNKTTKKQKSCGQLDVLLAKLPRTYVPIHRCISGSRECFKCDVELNTETLWNENQERKPHSYLPRTENVLDLYVVLKFF